MITNNNSFTKGIFILLISIIASSLTAQTSLPNFYNDYLDAKRRDKSYFETISGSPYLNSTFSKALVYVKGQKEPIISSMRYNNYFDEMEFITDSSEEFFLLDNKAQIDSIILNNNVYRYLNVRDNNTIHSGFFIFITGTKHKLYLKQVKEFQAEKPPTSGYDKYLPAAFIDKDDVFYAEFDGDPLVPIPTRKKKIAALLSENGISAPEEIRLRHNIESLTALFNVINDGKD